MNPYAALPIPACSGPGTKYRRTLRTLFPIYLKTRKRPRRTKKGFE
jgi:hypothetical protein